MLVCALTSAADAHAYIVNQAPQAQAIVATAPSVVTISFDEEIDLPDGPAIEVFDSAGKRVDKNDAAIDPDDVTKVVAHLNAIQRGSYTVRWRVVSADTHVVHGVFTFGVGVAAQSAQAAAESPFDPSAPLVSILRWFAFLGIAVAIGALLFRLAFRDALDETFERVVRHHVRYGAAIAIVASAGLFAVQSIASAGNVPQGFSGSGLLSTLHSSFGIPWIVRIAALIVVIVCSASRSRAAEALSVFAGALVLGTLSLAGHATTVPAYGTRTTMELADWVHLASISAWLGGLAVLIVGLASSHARDERLRRWLARFTKLAVPSVILMLATGLYASLAHEPHPTLLLTTEWGVSLAIKVALVIGLLAFGALSLRAGAGGALRSSGVVLRVEALLAVIILAVTAFLVGQSPPTCMFMPPGSHMPANMKMPPGMQMCLLPRPTTKGVNIRAN